MTRERVEQAMTALRSALEQVSAVKLKEMHVGAFSGNRRRDIVAEIDVYGHKRTLVCRVKQNDETQRVRRALHDLTNYVAKNGEEFLPMLIAPHLSPEAQQLCARNNAGYVDLDGNMRIVTGEFFISKKSLPSRQKLPPSAEPLPTSETARFNVA